MGVNSNSRSFRYFFGYLQLLKEEVWGFQIDFYGEDKRLSRQKESTWLISASHHVTRCSPAQAEITDHSFQGRETDEGGLRASQAIPDRNLQDLFVRTM